MSRGMCLHVGMAAIDWKFVRVTAADHALIAQVASAEGLAIGKAVSAAIHTYAQRSPATVDAAPGHGESNALDAR